MSDIEQARKALANWGRSATPGPWGVDVSGDYESLGADIDAMGNVSVGSAWREENATLIVAMTDPALREALDGMLEAAVELRTLSSGEGGRYTAGVKSAVFFHAEHLAAMILDIDGRVNA